MEDGRNYWQRRRLSRRSLLRGAAVGAAGLAGAALIGCDFGGDDDSTDGAGGTVSLVAANVFDSVDAHNALSSSVLQVTAAAQSKILRFSNPNTGELVGDLAERWEVVSPTELVLTLRDGVTWHDAGPGAENPASTAGRALTTEDIVFNIERQRDGVFADGSEGPFGRRGYWSKVADIEADDREIRLTLSAPDVTFVAGLANEFNTINQPELIEAVDSNYAEISPDKVIGTGPFILTEWSPGDRISGVRNPEYYDRTRPRLDGFVYGQAFEDTTAYRIGFEQKQVDAFSDSDHNTTLAIHEDHADDTNVIWSGVPNTVAAYTNTNIEPFRDLRLARAIDLALNRRQLIQQLHNGFGRVSGPVSWLQEKWALSPERLETQPGYRSGAERDADVAEANRLWLAAGGPDVGEIKWVIGDAWAARASWTNTPDLIAQMFNDAFNTSQFNAVTAPYSEIIPSWSEKTFDNYFAWISNVEVPDARADLLAAFGSESRANFWSVSEPANIDAKLARSMETLDLDEAIELTTEVQDFALKNGQFGRHIAYNYIGAGLVWNHYHPTGPAEGEGWNLVASSLDAVDSWLDSSDPSFEGRTSPTATPV